MGKKAKTTKRKEKAKGGGASTPGWRQRLMERGIRTPTLPVAGALTALAFAAFLFALGEHMRVMEERVTIEDDALVAMIEDAQVDVGGDLGLWRRAQELEALELGPQDTRRALGYHVDARQEAEEILEEHTQLRPPPPELKGALSDAIHAGVSRDVLGTIVFEMDGERRVRAVEHVRHLVQERRMDGLEVLDIVREAY